MLVLAAWYVYALSTAFIVICALMMLIILIQKPKGGGLSGAFGGAGGSANAAFGAKTGDVLTIITVGLFVAFLLCAMGLTWAVRPAHDEYMQQQQTLVEQIEQVAQDAVEDGSPTLPGEDAGEENPEPQTPNPNTGEDAASESSIEDLSGPTPDPEPQTPNPATDTPNPESP